MGQVFLERQWSFQLSAEFGLRDVTSELQEFVRDSGVVTGILVVQLVGSTGAVTTIEYESGALADLERVLASVVPADGSYEHNARWGDGNGFSHIRSAILKTSISIPVTDSQLALGTWQQVVVINFDNRSRSRSVVAVLAGNRVRES